MSDLKFTAHAFSRMSQRAISLGDIELAEYIGTAVEGGFLVRERDFQALDCELKKLRQQARRLVGKRVVRDGDVIVTAYYAGHRKQRRLLRAANARSIRI